MEHLTEEEVKYIRGQAQKMRVDIVEMITAANSGHTGGSLSAADAVALLYFHEMNIDPSDPTKVDRDRFVLSKGHAAPCLYAALAEKGYFPKEWLGHLRQEGQILQGHPDMKHTPGVDMTTGSLGQGFSAACGMALAGKLDKASWRVYAMMGDGELEEGQIWEAAMLAHHYKLDNLMAFVDNNGLQIDGKITDVLSPEPIDEKFRAFGWHAVCVNGHDIEQLHEAIEQARQIKGRPSVIVMKTIKGKGVAEVEGQVGWHGKAPTPEQCERFVKEIMEAE